MRLSKLVNPAKFGLGLASFGGKPLVFVVFGRERVLSFMNQMSFKIEMGPMTALSGKGIYQYLTDLRIAHAALRSAQRSPLTITADPALS